MAWRSCRRPRIRAPGLAVVVVAAALAGSVSHPVDAQPPTDLERRSREDQDDRRAREALDRAKELYQSAEAAMQDGRFDDAARDYGAAYELSKDPVLFFKIGRAHQGGGKCELAVAYYRRYLHEGKPTESFAALTREHMRACGADAREPASSTPPIEPRPDGSTAPIEPRSDGSAGGSGSAGTAPVQAGSAGSGSASADAGSGSAAPASAAGSAAAVLVPSNRQKVAWILTGGAIALTTLGGVLAYAASSSENDVRDLYVGFAGQPATFDAETRKKYDDLIDQGHRYQHLSWASFGIAGAAAVGAAVLFVIGQRPEPARSARITPIVTPGGAGVAIGF